VGSWLTGIGLGWLFGGLDWANIEGWRVAFVVVGLPGTLVACLVWASIKEPPRGHSDPPGQNADTAPGWSETFGELRQKPSFWWMAIGASLVAFVGYGLISFQAPFLQREHGLSVRDAALQFGAPLSLLAAVGTFLGGYITERLTERSPTAMAWVPAVGVALAVPAYAAAFFSEDLDVVFVLWGIGAVFHYSYLGAQYNIGQGVVSNRSRATAIAVLLILVSLIGNGIGPYFVGFMSDFFMQRELLILDGATLLSPEACSVGDIVRSATDEALCRNANSTGLKLAMAVTASIFLLASVCFLLCGRTLKADFVAELGSARS
jgi:predicted MFS family arabinose efflux permease